MRSFLCVGLLLAIVGCSAGYDESIDSQSDALRAPPAGSPRRFNRHHHHGHGHGQPPTGCVADADCGAGQFCQSPSGECGGEGQCTQEPQVCTRIYDPVCGCDGKTYGNPCEAQAAGVSVESSGECAAPQFCGGFAGIPCPGAGQCVDDPSDSCDPNNGGADCGGLCTCIATALCIQGYHFDTSPAVCGCVPDQNPCAAILCPTGTQCVVNGSEGSCEPIVDACASVRCRAGTHCVASGSTATCEPDAVQCGNVTCAPGLYCCNASCGMCAPPGVACIQIACE